MDSKLLAPLDKTSILNHSLAILVLISNNQVFQRQTPGKTCGNM